MVTTAGEQTSSIAGFMEAMLKPFYGTTKAGLIGLSKSLAIEAGRYGITVNTVCPGFIATEAVQLYDVLMTERIEKRAAIRRFGRPEEVAHVVAFLASEAASYITGAVIPVTGEKTCLCYRAFRVVIINTDDAKKLWTCRNLYPDKP